ncbi:MAG: hypothetical protein A3B67_17975 [Burkholderiales bacterium RIFCSPHIGHO2_02_FULL_66_10]|nr:MAG: hypothetical protein A3B67_17975 [Burkholderiales bacterium RIFCSPHIGHO2_02_FULL_66_10]
MHIAHVVVQQDLFHRQMGRGADAGRAQHQFTGVLLGPVHQIGERFPGAAGGHQHAEGDTRDLQDRAEVGHRVPGHMVHQGMAVHRDRHLADGVAVGLGGLEQRRHLRARRTRFVDDHDGLPQQRLGLLAQHAQRQVGLAARGPGHDELQRFVGPRGGHRAARLRQGAGQGGCESERCAQAHEAAP